MKKIFLIGSLIIALVIILSKDRLIEYARQEFGSEDFTLGDTIIAEKNNTSDTLCTSDEEKANIIFHPGSRDKFGEYYNTGSSFIYIIEGSPLEIPIGYKEDGVCIVEVN